MTRAGIVLELAVKDTKPFADFLAAALGMSLVDSVQDEQGEWTWAEMTFFGDPIMIQRQADFATEIDHPTINSGPGGFGIVCRVDTAARVRELVASAARAGARVIVSEHATDYGTVEAAVEGPEAVVFLLAGPSEVE